MLSNRIRIFLILKFPVSPELVFLTAFSLLGTPNYGILCSEI